MIVSNDSPATCPCGQPLHYSDPRVREIVEDHVRRLGAEITVSVIGDPRRFRVARHYIALHGLKATDLRALLRAGIVTVADAKATGHPNRKGP